MKPILAAAGCVLLSSGCASLDCNSDWHAIGQRDGRIGAESQAGRYAMQCPQIDRARYAEGLQAGFAMRPRVPSF